MVHSNLPLLWILGIIMYSLNCVSLLYNGEHYLSVVYFYETNNCNSNGHIQWWVFMSRGINRKSRNYCPVKLHTCTYISYLHGITAYDTHSYMYAVYVYVTKYNS